MFFFLRIHLYSCFFHFVIASGNGDEGYNCSYCKNSFRRKENLKLHIQHCMGGNSSRSPPAESTESSLVVNQTGSGAFLYRSVLNGDVCIYRKKLNK